jgi:DNA-binding beta-propeller fold protein YncE
LATDGSSLFVSDWGNALVQKFDRDGNFLLSFGQPVVGFGGLKDPTGLAATESTIYVADKGWKGVLAFDSSGNYLTTYAKGKLATPESLQRLSDGRLLVSDHSKVWFLDPSSDTLQSFDPEWNQGLLVTSSAIDANHNLLLADFDDNKIRVLTEGQTVYSGLVVRIARVNTRLYPEISVDFTVEDRWGRPVTGLKLSNFVLSESAKPLVAPTLAFQGFRSEETEVALVIDRDPSMAREEAGIREATGFLTQNWAARGGVWLYAAGINPLPQNQKLSGVSENQTAAVNPSTLTAVGQFDSAVRQAATSMIPSLKRRSVVYVTGGTVPRAGFARFNLAETAAYLRNNGIAFDVVSVNDAPLAPELTYLMESTGGKPWSVKKDLRPFESAMTERVTGAYSLKYTAITPPEAGTRAITVGIEVQNFKQSGRDQSTYFGPE